MIVKRGNVVSHAGMIEWGVGRVVEVTPLKATIEFSDGIIRKIASSHYAILHPADRASFVPIPEKVAVKAVSKRAKKIKLPAVVAEL